MRGAPQLVVCALLLTATAAPSLADPPQKWNVGRGYVLSFDETDGLWLRHGRRKTPLTIQGARVWGFVDIRVGRGSVTASFMPACEDVTETFTHDQLEARLVLVDAHRLRKLGQTEEAVKRFSDALAFDPTLKDAEHHLLRGLVALGREQEAMTLLAPRLAREPLATYIEIATDPALLLLRSRSELVSMRPGTVGTARVDGMSIELGPSGIAVSPGGWIATVEHIGNHGACFHFSHVVLRDAKTLARVGSLGVRHESDFHGDGCDGKHTFTRAGLASIKTRVAATNRVLEELGFAPPTGVIEGTVLDYDGNESRHRIRFGATGLGLVISRDGAARFFRHGRLLAEHPPGTVRVTQYLQRVVLLPDEGRVLVSAMEHGCEWAEHNDMVSLPAPP